MKKRILLLLSAFSLMLTGCSFVGGYKSVKQFVKEYLYRPVNDWILSFEKDEEKDSNVNVVIPEDGSKDDEKPSEPQETQEPGESEPQEADPVLVSIEVGGDFKTEYDVFDEFDSTGIIVSAIYDKGEPKDVSSEVSFSGFDSSKGGQNIVTVSYEDKTAEIVLLIHYTVEGVVYDFGNLLGTTLNDSGSYWGITLNFSEDGKDYSNTHASEDVLYPVAATLYQYYSPEYLELVSAKYYTEEEDYWEDDSGDTVYSIYLEVEEVGVEIISYCYKNKLLGQISVFSIAE